MKIKKISVIVTVIMTLLLSSLSLAQAPDKPIPPEKPGMQKMHKMHKMKKMHKKLNLTEEQKAKFQKMKITFGKKMIDLKANLEKSKLDMKAIQLSKNINRRDVIDVVKKINSNKNAIALATANHKMDMYEILTPEQRKIWKGFKMHKMRGDKMMKMKKMMKKSMH